MFVGIKSTSSRPLSKSFSPNSVNIAAGLAVRDTAKKMRTEISKETRAIYNAKASDIRSRSSVSGGGTYSTTASLNFTDNRPSLGRFSSGTKTVRTRVRKSRGSTVVKGGFRISKINPSLVFKRLTLSERADPRYAGSKLGIRVLRTISVPEMVSRVDHNDRLEEMARAHYASRFDHHYSRRS